MNKKVTDLEQFALEQIVRPYQTMIANKDEPLQVLPWSLEHIAKMLEDKTGDWSNLVLDRICRIGFYFPKYIQHPLVDVIRNHAQPVVEEEK